MQTCRHVAGGRITRAVAVLLMGFVYASPGFSGEASEPLHDDRLLGRAVNDVLSMGAEELEAFSNYLATCGALGPLEDGMGWFYCKKERLLYLSKFQRDRPIDHLMAARYQATRQIKITKEQPKFSSEVVAMGEAVVRITIIDDDLADAAAVRFQKLGKPR